MRAQRARPPPGSPTISANSSFGTAQRPTRRPLPLPRLRSFACRSSLPERPPPSPYQPLRSVPAPHVPRGRNAARSVAFASTLSSRSLSCQLLLTSRGPGRRPTRTPPRHRRHLLRSPGIWSYPSKFRPAALHHLRRPAPRTHSPGPRPRQCTRPLPGAPPHRRRRRTRPLPPTSTSPFPSGSTIPWSLARPRCLAILLLLWLRRVPPRTWISRRPHPRHRQASGRAPLPRACPTQLLGATSTLTSLDPASRGGRSTSPRTTPSPGPWPWPRATPRCLQTCCRSSVLSSTRPG
jgi:hypothetical protein